MKKLKFKPEDFGVESGSIGVLTASSCAQRAFDQWYAENIESAPVVYGIPNGDTVWHRSGIWKDNESISTHQARLICIEPIQRKECSVHDIQFIYSERDCVTAIQCKKCNKELRPKGGWEVVE